MPVPSPAASPTPADHDSTGAIGDGVNLSPTTTRRLSNSGTISGFVGAQVTGGSFAGDISIPARSRRTTGLAVGLRPSPAHQHPADLVQRRRHRELRPSPISFSIRHIIAGMASVDRSEAGSPATSHAGTGHSIRRGGRTRHRYVPARRRRRRCVRSRPSARPSNSGLPLQRGERPWTVSTVRPASWTVAGRR